MNKMKNDPCMSDTVTLVVAVCVPLAVAEHSSSRGQKSRFHFSIRPAWRTFLMLHGNNNSL